MRYFFNSDTKVVGKLRLSVSLLLRQAKNLHPHNDILHHRA